MKSLVFTIGLLFLISSTTHADVTGTNPSSGSCLCITGRYVNVRSSPCGSRIGQTHTGSCYQYLGAKQRCTLSGKSYEFFKIGYGSGGWVAGTLLNAASLGSCGIRTGGITGTNPSSGSCLCVNGRGVNVRSTACGSVIGQTNTGSCYRYLGSKQVCNLGSSKYEYFKLGYGSGGWIAGTLLKTGSASSCGGSSTGGGGSGGGGSSSGGCPTIISRSGWGARSPRYRSSIRRPVPKVFIHHTTGGGCTTQSACSSKVRGFQNYHMDTRGWSDIGYNFLVGEDGNVYEGRGWNYVGAHNPNYNSVSMGIAFIGDFSNRNPNSAALNAAQRLIACGVSQGKLSGSYTLHGHRDGRCTSCPGNTLYATIKTWPRYGGRLSGAC